MRSLALSADAAGSLARSFQRQRELEDQAISAWQRQKIRNATARLLRKMRRSLPSLKRSWLSDIRNQASLGKPGTRLHFSEDEYGLLQRSAAEKYLRKLDYSVVCGRDGPYLDVDWKV